MLSVISIIYQIVRLCIPTLLSTWISCSAIAALDSADLLRNNVLEIVRISPDGGSVPVGRQIVFQFNRPVVSIGQMDIKDQDIPIDINPKLECQWRWLNTSALSCNLNAKHELKPATLYKITVRPGIKAEDGEIMKQPVQHEFTTERPNVLYVDYKGWLAPGMPRFRAVFNQPVTQESVESSVVIITAEEEHTGQYTVKALPDPDTKLQNQESKTARRVWLIVPRDELPLDSAMILRLLPGLVSAVGEERGVGNQDITRFRTFPEFKFRGVRCAALTGDVIVFEPGKVQSGLCDPMARFFLVFNSPVLRSQVQANITFSPNIDNSMLWGDNSDYSRIYHGYDKDQDYEISIPGKLKPATEYAVQSKASDSDFFYTIWTWIKAPFTNAQNIGIQDEFGRSLITPIELVFKTDHRKPNFEIVHHNAVLESGIDTDVPLYVNNLKNITFHYRKLDASGAQNDLQTTQVIPQIQDVQFAIPLNVRSMLDGKSGALYGHLSTEPLINKYEGAHRLFAQVTPYQIHAKLGHFNSVIWVTDMVSGHPIDGAKVSIYQDTFDKLSGGQSVLSQAVTSSDGIAILDGTEKLDPKLNFSRSWQDKDEALFIRVDKEGELAILPINYDFAISSYRAVGGSIYPRQQERYGHIKSWGTTAQGIYRVGDVVQYKFYVRNQNNTAFTAPPQNASYILEVLDPTGKKIHEVKPLSLNQFGAYSGEFQISKQGAIGWYQFRLIADFTNDNKQDAKTSMTLSDNKSPPTTIFFPMRVLVSDFTPAPFKVSNQLNGALFQAGQEVEVESQAQLYSGGAYADANIRITAMLYSAPFISKNHIAKDFIFSSYTGNAEQEQIFQKIDRLDNKGENKINITLPHQKIYFGRLMLESAVQDDRGKYITAQNYADYAGVDRFVGLRSKEWLLEAGKESVIDHIVVNEQGEPIAGTHINIAIERQETKAARVKGPGNAYLTEFTNQWIQEANCTAVSSDSSNICNFIPKEPGYYRAVAKIKDTQGREHSTEINTYVVGGGHVLWNTQNDNILEIIPERTNYKVGDKARYLIKNPYPGAKALVTIERYGVLDHFVQTLDGSAPVIEFDINPDYIPGFYLSVVIFSPRAEKPIEGQVDLGKPTFKMGYAIVSVQDPYKEMLVSGITDQKIYKPREKVQLSLHAEQRIKGKAEPIELAIAVLDESVFDLISDGSSYFDAYKGFYQLEDLDLYNYSLLTRLIGRQKFEKKGVNSGGDGGSDLAMRNLFKFVSYWNPSIITDKNGNASVEFEAPDNLTGWKILAMAVTPSDRMGLGYVDFKVNRATEIRPVMPNQVIEGDNFDAGFNIMNRTDKDRELVITIRAQGDVDDKNPTTFIKNITLAAYKRATVWMPIKTSPVNAIRGTDTGSIKFTVTAEDKIDGDGVEHTLIVNKRRSLETVANYGTTTEDVISEPVHFSDKMHTDVGNISITISPSVISNISGAFEYIKTYPYSCWEQRLTKSVMASHYPHLRSYMSADFVWEDAKTLPSDTLAMAAEFQAPNGGMAYFKPQDQYADPYLSAYTALAFNWLKKSGYSIPEEVQNKLHTYLDNFLRHDTYPEDYDQNMASTVRAVALAALAANNKITVADLARYQPHIAQMSLLGKTYFVEAAMNVKGGDTYAIDATKLILSYANQASDTIIFSEQLDDSYNHILASPLRENCAILSTFTALAERKEGHALVGDIPSKLVNMIIRKRGNNTHWDNTQENVFCMKGLLDYAGLYEHVKPDMLVSVNLDNTTLGKAQFSSIQDSPLKFVKDITPEDLGKNAQATIKRAGQGRIYYTTRLQFAPLAEYTSAINSGIEVRREYSVERDGIWQLLQSPAELTAGDIVKVDLFISLPTARNFVVVNDPIPGGLEPINRDLATTSVVDADKSTFKIDTKSWWFKYSDWMQYNSSRWSFYHKELRHDAVRFYADYLPAGNYHLAYMTQVIAPGHFVIMPAHVEEMYNPEIFGKSSVEHLNVQSVAQ